MATIITITNPINKLLLLKAFSYKLVILFDALLTIPSFLNVSKIGLLVK
jgi:hypothetical protein